MNEFPIANIRAKYADQTPEGIDIDTALETLQQAIEGKVGFDGVIPLTAGPSNYIKASDIPTTNGIYKIDSDGLNAIMIVRNVGGSFNTIGIVADTFSYVFIANRQSYHNNFVPAAHILDTGTKLYAHRFRHNTNGWGFVIITSLEDLTQCFNSEDTIRNNIINILKQRGGANTSIEFWAGVLSISGGGNIFYLNGVTLLKLDGTETSYNFTDFTDTVTSL